MKRSAAKFHPAARLEVVEAQLWYWQRSQAAADDFLLQLGAIGQFE